MLESIWDLISRLSYIISILGFRDSAGIKEEIETLRSALETVLRGTLWVVTAYEPRTRDYDENVCLGVFTSKHGAARYLSAQLAEESWFSDEVRRRIHEAPGSGFVKIRSTDFDEAAGDITYSIMPVMHGMDPKK